MGVFDNGEDKGTLMAMAEAGFGFGGFFFLIYWFTLKVTGDYKLMTRDNIMGELTELHTAINDLRGITGFLALYLPWGIFLFVLAAYERHKLRWFLGFGAVLALFFSSIAFFQNMKDIAFIRRRLNEVEEFENPTDVLVNEYQTMFLTIHLNCCFEDDERPDLTCEALANDEPFVEPCIGNNETFEFFDGLIENGEKLCNRKVKIKRAGNRNTNTINNQALEKNILNDLAFCITGRRNYVRFLGRYTSNLTFHLMPISAIGGVGGLIASLVLFVLYGMEVSEIFFSSKVESEVEEDNVVDHYTRRYEDDIPIGEAINEKM